MKEHKPRPIQRTRLFLLGSSAICQFPWVLVISCLVTVCDAESNETAASSVANENIYPTSANSYFEAPSSVVEGPKLTKGKKDNLKSDLSGTRDCPLFIIILQ